MKPELAIGRLTLIYEKLTEHAKDVPFQISTGESAGVFIFGEHYADILEDVQALRKDLEKEAE